MNDVYQVCNIQKNYLASFLASISSCQIGCPFLRQKLVEWYMPFLTPGIYKRLKRNKNLKNPQNKNVGNDRFSDFLPSIKYIIVYYLWYNIIYLIQQSLSSQVLCGQTHQENISSILSTSSVSSTLFFEVRQTRHFMKQVKHISTPRLTQVMSSFHAGHANFDLNRCSVFTECLSLKQVRMVKITPGQNPTIR